MDQAPSPDTLPPASPSKPARLDSVQSVVTMPSPLPLGDDHRDAPRFSFTRALIASIIGTLILAAVTGAVWVYKGIQRASI